MSANDTSSPSDSQNDGSNAPPMRRMTPNIRGARIVQAICAGSGKTSTLDTVATLMRNQIHGCSVGDV